MTWKTIDSAPRDVDQHTKCAETVILGGEGWSGEGFYHDGSFCYGHRGGAGWFLSDDWGEERLLTASNVEPTHWQPLPAPPKGDEG